MRRLPLLLFVIAAVLLPTASPAAAQHGAYTDAPYAIVLETFVDGEGLVDYAGLKTKPYQLKAYLDQLAELDRATFDAWPEDEQIALLINAYNAFTLKAIVDHYPIRGSLLSSLRYPRNSIRQIPGVWTSLTFDLMGEAYTLDAIEKGWLSVDYDEPRFHMAVNCASIGCPPLLNEPYRGGVLEEQLDAQTERFLADTRYFQINRTLGVIKLSPIFHWYAADFRNYAPTRADDLGTRRAEDLGVIEFVSRYVDDATAASLRTKPYVIGYLGYDWSLNEQSN
ncbi:MAG: DUF547 domain-containing protein [Phycisphaeraceae bacterium]